MSDQSKIAWTDATWNPVRGCTKVSQGCKHCYAERFAERFRGVKGHPFEQGFDVRLVPEALDLPLRWRRPRRVFVNSMSDLFHEDVPFEFVDQVFNVMKLAPRHTFQVLTKRPARMREFLTHAAPDRAGLPYVMLGVSIEDQRAADERIPHLLATPAAVRFLSCEPLLGPVDLGFPKSGTYHPDPEIDAQVRAEADEGRRFDEAAGIRRGWHRGLHWVIAGGESGPKARPVDPAWARSLRDQCVAAGTAFFFKQWGSAVVGGSGLPEHPMYQAGLRVAQKNGGRILDGREWSEFPEVRHG